MPLQITADTTIASGQTVSSSNELNGVLIVSAAGLDRSPSLTIAGTLLHTTNWDNQTRGIAHLEGGFFQSSVVTIQSAGVFRVTANGTGTAFGMWSIAVVLFEMIGGRRPVAGRTADEVLLEIVRGERADLRTLRRDCPGPVADLLDRCLAPDFHKRPRNADELRLELLSLAAAGGVS